MNYWNLANRTPRNLPGSLCILFTKFLRRISNYQALLTATADIDRLHRPLTKCFYESALFPKLTSGFVQASADACRPLTTMK